MKQKLFTDNGNFNFNESKSHKQLDVKDNSEKS